ncbi:hypothetical protein ABIB25_002242 [Nakamurella sp. UYEF19]|uniref:hypothetical protein n=1 Tax=Nakamurella sp. UYEF19 TaxID=1756392 RepID=UPI003396A4A0
MSQHVYMRLAFGRSLMVTVIAAFTLIVSTEVASASEASNADAAADGALGLSATHHSVLLGMSVGTLTWVSIGLGLLVVGLISASKPGQRAQPRALPAAAGARRMYESSAVPAPSQGDLTKATLAVT